MPAAHAPEPSPRGSVSWVSTREDTLLLLEASADAVFVTDREGRIVFLNPTAQQMVGRNRDVIGHQFHRLFGCVVQLGQEGFLCPLEQTEQTGEVSMLPSHQWNHPDGTVREIVSTFWPRTQGGERVGVLVVCRDLTAAREAEHDLQRVARLAEDAPNPIVEFDRNGFML